MVKLKEFKDKEIINKYNGWLRQWRTDPVNQYNTIYRNTLGKNRPQSTKISTVGEEYYKRGDH